MPGNKRASFRYRIPNEIKHSSCGLRGVPDDKLLLTRVNCEIDMDHWK